MSTDAEEQTPAAAAPAAPKAKTSKVVLALLVLNLGGTGFGVFKMMTAHAEAPHEAVEKPQTEEVVGPVVPLEPFVVNLDEPGNARYLKLTIQVELLAHEGEGKL